ncbi:MAG: DNA mismatch repair endonuclease MutL [Candidatus Woesearchaeota archaeon]
MGDNIRLLDKSLIEKIAAGEVVENPSSVIKELIENSIDSNAKIIEIEVREGGKSYIKVKDNGDGMNENDAKLSIQRHATSKITSEDDLFNIATLGFRGEALASISAVSKFSLVTKKQEDVSGIFLSIEDHNIISKEIGTDKGTIVTVKDLFYNVPARKKFLGNMQTELNMISDVITKYALAYYNISFKLISDGKIMINTNATNEWKNTIQSLYGNADDFLEINKVSDLIEIKGYLGKPSIARNNKTRQTLFINGRYVKNKEISEAIKKGYHSMLFLDNQPVYILKLKVKEKTIDVNVHPKKEIVKIDNIELICQEITNIISEFFKNTNLTLDADLSTGNAKAMHTYNLSNDKQSTLSVPDNQGDKFSKSNFTNIESPSEYKIEAQHIGPIKIIGQIAKTYIIAESARGILIVDQHAAEERVNYENLMKQLNESAIKKQTLLKPIIIELSPLEHGLVTQWIISLNKCGFEIEEYGDSSIIIRTMPFIFERPSKTLIFDLIEDLKHDSSKIQKEIEDRIIRFSCRMSIKAGDELSNKEMENLLIELDKCELPFTCPHGRPTIIQFSIADLEKKFKRTG